MPGLGSGLQKFQSFRARESKKRNLTDLRNVQKEAQKLEHPNLHQGT